MNFGSVKKCQTPASQQSAASGTLVKVRGYKANCLTPTKTWRNTCRKCEAGRSDPGIPGIMYSKAGGKKNDDLVSRAKAAREQRAEEKATERAAIKIQVCFSLLLMLLVYIFV